MPQDARVVEFDPKSFLQLLDTVQKSMVQYLEQPVGEIKFSTSATGKVDYALIPADFDIGAGDTMVITNDHKDAVKVEFFDPKVFGLVQLILPDGYTTLLTVNGTAVKGQLAWDHSDNSGGGTQPITVRPPQ